MRGEDSSPAPSSILHDTLRHDSREPVAFLYYSGWRVGEIRSLEWRDVDESVIRLRRENSKNGKGRSLPLRCELAEILKRAEQRRRLDSRRSIARKSRASFRPGPS